MAIQNRSRLFEEVPPGGNPNNNNNTPPSSDPNDEGSGDYPDAGDDPVVPVPVVKEYQRKGKFSLTRRAPQGGKLQVQIEVDGPLADYMEVVNPQSATPGNGIYTFEDGEQFVLYWQLKPREKIVGLPPLSELSEDQLFGSKVKITAKETLFKGERSEFQYGGEFTGNQTAEWLISSIVPPPEENSEIVKDVVNFNVDKINVGKIFSSAKSRGSPQDCASLLQTIRNIIKDIKKRTQELADDWLNLPETTPDDDVHPRKSRRGHRRLINEAKANLAKRKGEYVAYCGELPEDVRSSEDQNVNWFRLPDWAVAAGVVIIGGAILIAATVTLPAWGLAALAGIAALLGLRLIDQRPV